MLAAARRTTCSFILELRRPTVRPKLVALAARGVRTWRQPCSTLGGGASWRPRLATVPPRRLGVHFSTAKVVVPRDKVEVRFSRSSGPGGQNVNKVNTKAEIRFAVSEADWLDDDSKQRLMALFPNRVTRRGEFVVTSQLGRTQHGNLNDAFSKLEDMCTQASKAPKVRKLRTEPSKASKARRVDDKRKRSQVKQSRQRNRIDKW